MDLIERKEPYFIDLLEFFDPYEDASDSEVVTEVSGPVIDDINILKPGDVIHAYFPYLNANGGGKHRWGIIVWVDNQIKALGCFSIKDPEHRKKVLRYETNYVIPDWTNYGFTRESYAKATAVYPMERIHDIRIIGKVSDEIYKICMKKIGLVNRKMYSDPWSYLALLQRKNVMESIPSDGVSNNSNVLQTPHDIIENGSANCVDLALAVHVICLNSGLAHVVVKTTFVVNEHKSTGHIYCIIKKGNGWHVFRYMPPTKPNGKSISEIKQYMLPNLEAVIKAEEKWLKPHHDRINGCNTTVESYVFTEDDIAFAEKCLMKRRTQSYMLNGVFGPASLMKRIAKYDWGCVVNGKNAKDSLENWILNWRLLNHEQFDAVKCGCCWDYVAYEEWYFRENIQALLPTKSWYLETEPITYDDSTNHTWLSYKRGNKVYAFEAAWKIYQGIREFDSEKEMIDWYLDKFYGGHDVEENYVVYTYHSKPGMDATKFSKNIFTKGKLVAKKGNHFAYRIKPIIEKDDWTNMGEMWGRKTSGVNAEPIRESNNSFSKRTNLFITEGDIYCNMGRFLKRSPDQVNICFVTGFSGSGKSTLAKKLASYHKITYVELDYLTFAGRRRPFTEKDCINNGHEILWKYIKDTHKDPAFYYNIDSHDGLSQLKETISFVKWLEKQAGNFVVEGIQCVDIIPANPKWLEYPIIFKGTSFMTSFVRGILRDEILTRDGLVEGIKCIIERFKWFYADKPGFDHLRHQMIHQNNHAEAPASVWDGINE